MSEHVFDKIDEVAGVSGSQKSAKSSSAVISTERVAPDKELFDSMMQGNQREAASATSKENSVAANVQTAGSQVSSPINGIDPNTLVARTEEAVQRIEQIKETLSSQDVQNLKESVQQLLHNKLSHIDENLKIALSKVGSEFNPNSVVAEPSTRINPIERFLYFLTDGQWQLQNLGSELRQMSLSKKEITPVNMLAVQVKIGQIQQEIELFSNMLNKALESIKTIMNIQV